MTSSSRPRLPPGPGTLRALLFVRAPFEFLDACARRYGDWFTLRFPGVPPFLFTSDPTAIRKIFNGDAEQLRAGEANAPLGAFMGPQSVLFLDGAAHLHERQLLLPPFHSARMQAYGALMTEIADRSIDQWPIGVRFPLLPLLRAITFEVILSAVFGFDEGSERTQLRERLTRLFAIFNSPLGALLGVPMLQIDFGRLTPWGRVVQLKREIETILYAECARRRATGCAGRTDVLSLLIDARDEDGEPMPDTTLRDEMLTLLLAGHETTAASLAWVFHHLLRRPEVLGMLRAELRGASSAPERLGELPYLDAVIKETSRLDPVIPNVGRILHIPVHRPAVAIRYHRRVVHLLDTSPPRPVARSRAFRSGALRGHAREPVRLLPLWRRCAPLPRRRLRDLRDEDRPRARPVARRVATRAGLSRPSRAPQHRLRADGGVAGASDGEASSWEA